MCRHVRFDEVCFPFGLQPRLSLSRMDLGGAAKPWAISPMPTDCVGAQRNAPAMSSGSSTAMTPPAIVSSLSMSLASSTTSTRSDSPSTLVGLLLLSPSVSGALAALRNTHPMILRYMTHNNATADAALVAIADSSDPTCYSQAVWFPEWRSAIGLEFNTLLHNKTWKLVPSRPDMNVIGFKWVFRTKRKSDGSIERHKARLVAKGFNQVTDEDYF